MGCNTGIFKGNYIDGKPQYKRKFIIIYCRREKSFVDLLQLKVQKSVVPFDFLIMLLNNNLHFT